MLREDDRITFTDGLSERRFPANIADTVLPAPAFSWNQCPPAGVDYFAHRLRLIGVFVQADCKLFRDSDGGLCGRLLIGSPEVVQLAESLPNYSPEHYTDPINGEQLLGYLLGRRWEVRRSVHVPIDQFILQTGDDLNAMRVAIRIFDRPDT